MDDKIREAFSIAIVEHLGPSALLGGNMSIYDAAETMFNAGYQTALASLDAVTILSAQHPDGIETIYRTKESKIPMRCQTHRAAHQDSPTKPASS